MIKSSCGRRTDKQKARRPPPPRRRARARAVAGCFNVCGPPHLPNVVAAGTFVGSCRAEQCRSRSIPSITRVILKFPSLAFLSEVRVIRCKYMRFHFCLPNAVYGGAERRGAIRPPQPRPRPAAPPPLPSLSIPYSLEVMGRMH